MLPLSSNQGMANPANALAPIMANSDDPMVAAMALNALSGGQGNSMLNMLALSQMTRDRPMGYNTLATAGLGPVLNAAPGPNAAPSDGMSRRVTAANVPSFDNLPGAHVGPGFFVSPETRAKYAPTAGMLNVSMDFNAAPGGGARGTEVIVPNNASPAVRAAAERYNALVAEFAASHGIADYPVRGVRTVGENGRGVAHTIHTEPFFNDDLAMQEAVNSNPGAFAQLYQQAFGHLDNARLIAPHGIGNDRGAVSPVFGDETTYGRMMANALLSAR